ncbi:MAG TPA: NADH-quinone oxidoreductase subunit H [Acetobacteraceae bacterium]|nr:NADH-quinone oxidoreductase subunit H [Acetobacteraceae bacterium]
MSLLAALLAQLLHTALVLAAAPFASGLRRWTEAVMIGRHPPDPRQPWRDLRRLLRKQPVVAENASPVLTIAPLVCVAAMALAAALVPTFTLGMAFAPMSDLLVLGGLLAGARVALALAALDAGTAPAGLAAARAMSLGCLAEAVLLLAILALGLLGGTTNLDLLMGQQRQGLLQPLAATVLTAIALATIAVAEPGMEGQATEFSGGDLALATFADQCRQLIWLNLIAGLFLPWGMAEPDGGLLAWLGGALAWAAKVLALMVVAAAIHCVAGTLRPGRRPVALGIAAALALLAAIVVLASAAAA